MGKLNVNPKDNKVNTETPDEISKMQKLDSLLQTFFEKFDEARSARWDILEFLENEYDVEMADSDNCASDENIWCFGLDADKIKKLIKE